MIGWYAGEERLARFDIISDSPPFSVALSSPLNATVQISSVHINDGFYTFLNFTLSAPINNFLAIRGLGVTCGTLIKRSETFRVQNFTLFGKPDWSLKYCFHM